MADVGTDKKLKLANTKKRFKELQELKKKRYENTDSPKAITEAITQSTGQSTGSNNSAHSSNRNTPIESTCENPNILDDIIQTPVHICNANQNTFLPEISHPSNVNHFQYSSESQQEESALPYDYESSPVTFFDNIPRDNSSINVQNNTQSSQSPSLLTYFNTTHVDTDKNNAENIGLPRYFDNAHSNNIIWENTVPGNDNNSDSKQAYHLFEDTHPPKQDANLKQPSSQILEEEDTLSLDYPEIQQSQMNVYQLFPIANPTEQEARKSTPKTLKEDNQEEDNSEVQRSKISDYLRKSVENLGPLPVAQYNEHHLESVFSPGDNQKLMDYLGTTGATEEEQTDISHSNREIDDSTDITQKEIHNTHNIESLKQLSDQLAQMIEPEFQYSSTGSVTDLEKRNIELAANLDREKVSCEQLKALNVELNKRIAQLESKLAKCELNSTLQEAQEVFQLKNELQTHLQTIGLLVAEKTELSSNLSQYELNFKQKVGECEELHARLKASRTRVADLERELNNVRSEKVKFNTAEEQMVINFETLKREYLTLKEQKDELAQDLLEVREKLKNTSDENVKLQQDKKELAGKLSLAEIKIQQLSSVTGDVDSQIEQLTQEKFSLEGEIANMNQMLKSIVKERDESTVQYQNYAQQLNDQISNLSSKLEQLQQEKENLVIQEQNRIKHIGELERQLQNVQNDQVTYATRNSNNSGLKSELDNTRELCVQLQIEKTSIEENYTRVSIEKELLLKELEAKRDSISQLESLIEQLKGNQPDSVKLLATMESDKVAASRAIQQNKELKQQLESMQEVFMKMDNDKVVLTENLKAQQQTNKELMEKLQKTELTLQSLADAIEIKDKELTHLRETSEEMNRQALQHKQLEDRLRHYEAHDNSAHALQHELQESKQTIAKLSSELNSKRQQEKVAGQIDDNVDLEGARQKVLELTNEINKLKLSNYEAQEKIKVEALEEFNEKQLDRDGIDNVLNKENAMKYLEEKVKRTMQEIADLTDEKQRLEHIVLQLQGETETIGEYISLYQHQRMMLKQKALEKDQQLKQLASDREQIKIKLDRLNGLIRKLVSEKGTVPAELIQHQESLNSHVGSFCEEHSKMHEDINRIKDHSNVIEPYSEENKANCETAEEIISLLSEIKTSNLVQPDENFHHCPWCSGQLMTV